jgi:hypothetical protein
VTPSGWFRFACGRRATALIGTGFVTVRGNEFQGAAYVFVTKRKSLGAASAADADKATEFDFLRSASHSRTASALIGAESAATDGNRSRTRAPYIDSRARTALTQTQILAASDGESFGRLRPFRALQMARRSSVATGVTVGGVSHCGRGLRISTCRDSLVEAVKLTPSDRRSSVLWLSRRASSGKQSLGAYTTTAAGNERQGAVYVYGPDAAQP